MGLLFAFNQIASGASFTYGINYDVANRVTSITITESVNNQEIYAWEHNPQITSRTTVGSDAVVPHEITVISPDNGEISSSTHGIDCGGACNTTADDGMIVNFIATPDTGFAFVSWGNDCQNTITEFCDIVVDSNKTISAVFIDANLDTDFDGIPDYFEIRNGLDFDDPVDAGLDADGDGLSNLEEFELGLVFNDPDSDGDGIHDGIDPTPNLFNNLCSGSDPILENQTIVTDIVCAGSSSVIIEGTVEAQFNGDLLIISPITKFRPGFSIENGGIMKVQSLHPCPMCP